jgi:hypothetical protein
MKMMSRFALPVAVLATAASAGAAPFCAKIAAFARTPLAHGPDGFELPRSVELLWLGDWGDLTNMGWECRYHGDPAGRRLCHALTPPPQEFRTGLIFEILRCYGYRFPNHVIYRWHAWRAEIGLNRGIAPMLRLDVNMYGAPGRRDAIRLVVLPSDVNPDAVALPTIDEPIPPPVPDQAPAASTSGQ